MMISIMTCKDLWKQLAEGFGAIKWMSSQLINCLIVFYVWWMDGLEVMVWQVMAI